MVQYSMEKRLWILVHVGHVSFCSLYFSVQIAGTDRQLAGVFRTITLSHVSNT